MGAEQTDLSGPDLTRGVPVSDLADGEMIAGHARGEAVLLARRGDELFAIGATCTHYSGPLGEGLLVDDTVRCPWHHASFSLRTGEALRAPALQAVPCWHVERQGNSVFVTDKKANRIERRGQGDPHRAGTDSEPLADIVIMGGGAAGDAAAGMLRREGYDGRITLISADDAAPYDRPNLSKDYLAGTAPEAWLPLRPSTFYDDHDIRLILGTRATTIDPEAGRVALANGRSYRFDRLLLATGADPIRLPIPGMDQPHVYYLRTLADCRAILSRQDARRAVVIGAGFIGMEAAASLRTRGMDVHVAAPESHPMERVFGPELGAMIRSVHEEHGVVFHLEQTAASIDTQSITLSSGKRIAADIVVIGAGVRPATGLAEQAGLKVKDGILVDAHLETSHAGIFAAGDAARWSDPRTGRRMRVEHWAVAQRQGQVAARNMLGRRQMFEAIPFFWTQHYDIPIAYVGHAPSWDRIDVAGSIEDRNCLVAFRLQGQTLAVASIYRDRESLRAEVALERSEEPALHRLVDQSH